MKVNYIIYNFISLFLILVQCGDDMPAGGYYEGGTDIYTIPAAEIDRALRGDPNDPRNQRVIKAMDAWTQSMEAHRRLLNATVLKHVDERTEALFESTRRAILKTTSEFSGVPVHELQMENHPIGSQRFVMDNVIDEELCQKIIESTERYIEKTHNVYPAFEMVLRGVPGPSLLVLHDTDHIADAMLPFLIARERMRSITQQYFNLSALYVDASHVTRRRMRPNDAKWAYAPEDDHGSHADNCQVQYSGECIFKPEHCCFWRDYSTIMFLNEADAPDRDNRVFSGGEFYFEDEFRDEDDEYTIVPPKCGRMVSFSSGAANMHGVRRVLGEGYRWALALWQTVNPEQQEHTRGMHHFPGKWRAAFDQWLSSRQPEQFFDENGEREQFKDDL